MIQNILTFINNNLFAIVTAIIAVVALFQTHKQMKISNKQFLFDKRLEKYIILKGMLTLYKDNVSLLDYTKEKDDEPICVDTNFIFLTNNSYLKDITKIITSPFEEDYRQDFLLMLEEIKKQSFEIRFLFKGKIGKYMQEFLYQYQDVLMNLYKYQIITEKMRNYKVPTKEPKDYKTLQKELGEKKYREKLFQSIKKIKDSYNNLEKNKIIRKAEKKIQL